VTVIPEKPEEESFGVPEKPTEEPQHSLFGMERDNENSNIDQVGVGAESTESAVPEPEPEPDESSMTAAQLFEYKQKQYLLGKRVTKTIYSQSGEIIVQAGDIITESVIDTAKREGKLIDLVMNYE